MTTGSSAKVDLRCVCVCVCECVIFRNHVTLIKEACHTCLARVTLMNESCHTLTHMSHMCVTWRHVTHMSHVSHLWVSHVTHWHICHTYVWHDGMSHICLARVTLMNESCHTLTHMSHMCVTWLYMCVTWQHVTHVLHMSHIWMSHVTHMNDSSHTQCVSYMWTRGAHVTHMVGVTWLILNHSFWNHSYVTWYEIIHMCHDTKSFIWVRKNAWMNSCHVTDEWFHKKFITWMNSYWNHPYVTWREIIHMWHDMKSFIWHDLLPCKKNDVFFEITHTWYDMNALICVMTWIHGYDITHS